MERGGRLWEQRRGQPAKVMMKALVGRGRAQGILAFDGENPVGRCSFGPRSGFPRIETVKAYRRDDAAGVWCIGCFFIGRGYRGQVSDACGVAQPTISKVERGETQASLETILRIMSAVGLELLVQPRGSVGSRAAWDEE